MAHEGPMRSFLLSQTLFAQIPNLDPNPNARPARRAAAPVRGTAAAAGGRAVGSATARARGGGGGSRPARAWGRNARGCCGAPGRGCRLRPLWATVLQGTSADRGGGWRHGAL